MQDELTPAQPGHLAPPRLRDTLAAEEEAVGYEAALPFLVDGSGPLGHGERATPYQPG
jgi:hypothetical protein